MEPGSGWKPGGGESPLRVRLPPLLLTKAVSHQQSAFSQTKSGRREPVEASACGSTLSGRTTPRKSDAVPLSRGYTFPLIYPIPSERCEHIRRHQCLAES